MNPTDMASTFDAQISVKCAQTLVDGLKDIKKSHGLEPAEILRRLGESAVEFYKVNGYFAFPVRLFPEAEFRNAVIHTAETPQDRARFLAEEKRRKATGTKTG